MTIAQLAEIRALIAAGVPLRVDLATALLEERDRHDEALNKIIRRREEFPCDHRRWAWDGLHNSQGKDSANG